MGSNHFCKIVLTGGPCAGKTTALSYLYDKLSAFGFMVVMVPESARLILSSGVSLENANFDQNYSIEDAMLQLQHYLEATFAEAASQFHSPNGKPVIMLLDRGRMDVKGFTKPEVWETIVSENDYSEIELRDWPYDAIVHMVTAANGAEAFYRLDGVRRESLEESREIDARLQHAWVGHPHLTIIENGEDGFEGKLKRTLAAVLKVVGYPMPIEIERKYLVKSYDISSVRYQKISIEQFYLLDGDRVRKRGQNGKYTYTRTTKQEIKSNPGEPLQRIESERQITAREYLEAVRSSADPLTKMIVKDRYCFLYEGQYFELDVFAGKWSGTVVLEIELSSPDKKVVLPPWIEITEEVTDNKLYSNFEMAKGGACDPPGACATHGRCWTHSDWEQTDS
jgi:CYTH domain-containing protein/predicted ATPase